MGWKNLGEKPVVETPWFRLNLADVELPGGRRLDHYMLRLPPVALAAVLDADDRVLLEAERIDWIPLAEVPGLVAGRQVRSAVTAAVLMLLLHRRPGAR